MTVIAMAVAAVGTLRAQTVAERHPLYDDGPAQDVTVASWRMQREERKDRDRGLYLWFNQDCRAEPWAGVTFKDGAGFALTDEWLRLGFVRFLVNIGLDRYGNIGGGVLFQVRPEVAGIRYQALRGQHIDRGRGADEDVATWQEVLVPLAYWTELKAGQSVKGVGIQCRGRPERAFGIDDVGFVCFDALPEWLRQRDNERVAQPQVSWPLYDELPSLLRADQHPPQVHRWRFEWPDGRRCFVLNPYCREDPTIDLLGGATRTEPPPTHGLYDRERHGWLYDQMPAARNLCRLGFNSLSATMPPQPWWDETGYDRRDYGHVAARLPESVQRVGLPFYVDTVSWPWTLGAPGENPTRTKLPPAAFTQGRHHWTQYRIIGAGCDAWLRMWRLYARRYRDAGASVLVFELMNEPAYVGFSEDHHREFEQWLRQRHGALSALDEAWQTRFKSWEAAARVSDEKALRASLGRALDYDEYLAGRFTELMAEGVKAVNEILPRTLVGVQPMGGYALAPRESVWKHLIVRHETAVLTPTGGGRWTSGRGASARPPAVTAAPMASAPLEDDLLLALAEDKMLYDNETYLRGQTGTEVRNRLWEQVLAGLDGLTVFSWSKRGWAWFKDRAAVQTEADKFPYCNLNPLARRTAALRGILDFAREVQPLASDILPKPWGPAPRIGVLYDWAQARRHVHEGGEPDKTADYYAALKFSHWNMTLVPSDRWLAGETPKLDVLVVGGVRYAERKLPATLRSYVEQGGVLIVGEEALDGDLYGRPLNTSSLLGVEAGDVLSGGDAEVAFPAHTALHLDGPVRIRAGLRSLRRLPGTAVLLADSRGRPVVTRRTLGRGWVYFQAADVTGYGLAKVVWCILDDAAQQVGAAQTGWRLAEIQDTATGHLATNVLLSRRAYEDHQVLLLMNRDEYSKRLVVRPSGLLGRWRVREAITEQTPAGDRLPAKGVVIDAPAGEPRVLLLRRAG